MGGGWDRSRGVSGDTSTPRLASRSHTSRTERRTRPNHRTAFTITSCGQRYAENCVPLRSVRVAPHSRQRNRCSPTAVLPS